MAPVASAQRILHSLSGGQGVGQHALVLCMHALSNSILSLKVTHAPRKVTGLGRGQVVAVAVDVRAPVEEHCLSPP